MTQAITDYMINQSLTAFWFMIGKSNARDGKPAHFALNKYQVLLYSKHEKEAAEKSYAAGYAAGLPE